MKSSLQLLNLFTYLILVTFNYCSVKIPFFGRSVSDVSDLYPNLLTPADFTFLIWPVIYTLLGIFVFGEIRLIFKNEYTCPKEVNTIGYMFLSTSIMNVLWLILWQNLYIFPAFICIACMWISLIVLNYRLTTKVNARWMYSIPFSIYLAWICVATLATLNILLIDTGFNFYGLNEDLWTSILIVIGVFGTLLVIYLNQDLWFTLVLIWAYYGMYMKNYWLESSSTQVLNTCIFAIIFLSLVACSVGIYKWIQFSKTRKMS